LPGSDDLARDAVQLWAQDPAKLPLSVDVRRILVMELIDGRVTEDDEDAVLTIFERSSDADILVMFTLKDSVAGGYKPPAEIEIREVAAKLGSDARKRLEDLIAKRFPTRAPDKPKGALEGRPIANKFVHDQIRDAYAPVRNIGGIEVSGVFLQMNDGTVKHVASPIGAYSSELHETIAKALATYGDTSSPPYFVDVLCTYHSHPGDKDKSGVTRLAPSGADVHSIMSTLYQGSSIFGHEHYVISPFTVYAIKPTGSVEALGSTETVIGVATSPEFVTPPTALEYP
jgi:hypothetical protein